MQRWQRWMATMGLFYIFGERKTQDGGSRVWGGAGCGSGGGVWGCSLGQWLYIPKTRVSFRNCPACVLSVCVCTRVGGGTDRTWGGEGGMGTPKTPPLA